MQQRFDGDYSAYIQDFALIRERLGRILLRLEFIRKCEIGFGLQLRLGLGLEHFDIFL